MLCEVCKGGFKESDVVVCTVPMVPYSARTCRDCLKAGAIPYWIATANTDIAGGWDNCIDEWKDVVNDTLKHLNIPMEQFLKDVKDAQE